MIYFPSPLSGEDPYKAYLVSPSKEALKCVWILSLPDERSLSEKGPSFDSYQQKRGNIIAYIPFFLHRVSMVEKKIGPPRR
jgi:hypothetical protein